MADVDLNFVGDQLQRVLQELGGIRSEQAAMRQELAAMHSAQSVIAVAALQTRYRATIEVAIAEARRTHTRATTKAPGGSEAYACLHRHGSIAWGVNAAQTGVNVLRGIRRPDGADEAVS
jgi:hypothetical protein